ncbi:MAG: DNA adenine methylase [Parcubacteria group bacterium Gr01-1014_31]|nr:MAG: DNA adenine methylase [Parcubacteria group bacterium Gr01-1014_31]
MAANYTILRWAGSKRQLVPLLSSYWRASQSKRYVEPFAGSACLFFNVAPKEALLADINLELIATYRQIKKDWKGVLAILEELDQSKQTYYSLRSLDSKKINNPLVRAARFVYLNRFCFNGLYRTNQSGQFNVPYGKTGSIPSELVFSRSSKLLKRAHLLAADFDETLRYVRKGDFVYMDPPFSVHNKNIFTDYDSSKFDFKKLIRLRKWMRRLSRMRIPFLVSYLESNEAKMLSEGFYKRIISVRRSIAGFSSNRKAAREFLISNILV